MYPRKTYFGLLVLTLASSVAPATAAPLGAGITYQGQVKDGGKPANGTYDLQFKLFDAAVLGLQVGLTIQLDNVSVANGLFTVPLDFGDQFNGDARWLEVGVHPGAQPVGNPYTLLTPRQPLTAAPHALGLRLPFSQTTATNSDVFNITTTGGGDGFQFNISNPASVAEALEARTDGGGDSIQGINTGTGRAGYFQTTNPANNLTAVRVDTNSTNAGVGALAGVNAGNGPAGVFQINNVANSAPVIHTTTTGTGSGLRVQNGSDTLDIKSNSINTDGNGFFGDPLYFNNNISNSVLIGFGGGNVGIGGGAAGFPVARLHVDDGTDSEPGGGGFLVLGGTAGANISFDNNEIMARNNGATSGLFLNNDGGNVHMAVASGGVSIGTTTIPAGVLLAVDGKILCEEMEVQLSGDWPDFVFGEDYPLMPLDQLEASVAADKHLPGIPSAETVAKDGINVGEMQTKLLLKVEELTLYVIDVNKQVEAVRVENEQLRARIAQLEGGR